MKIPTYRDISHASRQVATKSAMNPIQWISAIGFPAGLVGGYFLPEPLNYVACLVGALPIVTSTYGFLFFAHTDANRLQSEQHIENLQMLARVGGKPGTDTVLIEQGADTTNRQSGGAA